MTTIATSGATFGPSTATASTSSPSPSTNRPVPERSPRRSGGRRNADRRLRRLEDDGAVVGEKIGHSPAWRLADEQPIVRHVDPDDAFREAGTYVGEATSAADVDDILYR